MKPIVSINYCGTDYFRPELDQYCIRRRQDLDIILEDQNLIKNNENKLTFENQI